VSLRRWKSCQFRSPSLVPVLTGLLCLLTYLPTSRVSAFGRSSCRSSRFNQVQSFPVPPRHLSRFVYHLLGHVPDSLSLSETLWFFFSSFQIIRGPEKISSSVTVMFQFLLAYLLAILSTYILYVCIKICPFCCFCCSTCSLLHFASNGVW